MLERRGVSRANEVWSVRDVPGAWTVAADNWVSRVPRDAEDQPVTERLGSLAEVSDLAHSQRDVTIVLVDAAWAHDGDALHLAARA